MACPDLPVGTVSAWQAPGPGGEQAVWWLRVPIGKGCRCCLDNDRDLPPFSGKRR
jgi:hypothetical protein